MIELMQKMISPIIEDHERSKMQMRIYSYYDQAELDSVRQAAEEIGLSVGAYQKYCTLLTVRSDPKSRNNTIPITELIAELDNSLNNKPSPSEPFIVSSLISPEHWTNLNRSEKKHLADHLTSFVNNSSDFEQIGKINGIKQYRRR